MPRYILVLIFSVMLFSSPLCRAIDITKTPDTQTVNNGDTATFTIRVANTSISDFANSISVSDPLTPDCDRTAGTLPNLPPGSAVSYSCETGPLVASFTNEATVNATVGGSGETDSDTAYVEVLPLLVVLKSFDARVKDKSIILTWATSAEIDVLGFHINRQPILNDGSLGKELTVTKEFIPSQGDDHSGERYRYIDTPDHKVYTWRYTLMSIETNGSRSPLATIDVDFSTMIAGVSE